MHPQLYPMTMEFPSSLGPIYLTIDATGWGYAEGSYTRFCDLPVGERLNIRSMVWEQVHLASQTPKGDR